MTKKKRINNIIDALDLGFSDIHIDENVRQLTLENKLDEMEIVVNVSNLATAINFSIFNTRGSDHPSSEIYSINFPSDLGGSIYAILGGYYRQAIMILRSLLEIRLTGIYYGFVHQNQIEYDKWKKGLREAPHGRTLIGRLFERHEFRNMDDQIGLRTRLENLYGELCTFVHGGGIEKYNLSKGADNVPRFISDSFDLWYDFLLRVFSELTICYYVAYGRDSFDNLSEQEIENLKQILLTDHRRVLEKAEMF